MKAEQEINPILRLPLGRQKGKELGDLYNLLSVFEPPKKSVRRDEVARLYGVSESVQNALPNKAENNLCLAIKAV